MNVDSAFYENNFSLIQVISNRRVIVERVSNQKKKEFQYSFLTIILKIISTVKKIKQIIVTALTFSYWLEDILFAWESH